MSTNRKSAKGFSLVELLAVVLVLAALAAIAIPLYTAQRQSAAARTCKANLAAIASALSAYSLRIGAYPTSTAVLTTNWTGDNTGGVIGAPEGLAAMPSCPLTGAYTYTVAAGVATVTCPNAATHAATLGVAADYSKVMPKPAADSLP